MNILSNLIPKAYAVAANNPGVNPVTNLTSADITTIANNIANWMLFVLIAIAGVFVTIAAFQYLLSGGDEKKVAAAKNKIIYAAVGIAVGILARSIAGLVDLIV